MQGLPPGVTLRWSLDRARVKKSKNIVIAGAELEQGKTLTIEPILCSDYSMLAGELPDIEIGGLSNEAALQVLMTFMKDSYDRIPNENAEGKDGVRKYSSWGSSDPVPQFKDRVAGKAIPIIEELADRDPGSEFELKLLVSAGTILFYDPGFRDNFGTKATNFRSYCQRRLLKNHVGNDDAQELLIDTAGKMFAHKDNNRHLRELYEASPFKKTKVNVAARMLGNLTFSLQNSSKESAAQSDFEKQFAEFDKMATIIDQNVELLSPRANQVLNAQLGHADRSLVHHFKVLAEETAARPNAEKMNEPRLKRFKKRVDQIMAALANKED